MILLGEVIDATEALRYGLANYVVPAIEMETRLANVLTKLRELSPSSLAMTRRAISIGGDKDFDKSLKVVEDLYLNQLMKTEDANEGLRSFMEKRKPEWKSK